MRGFFLCGGRCRSDYKPRRVRYLLSHDCILRVSSRGALVRCHIQCLGLAEWLWLRNEYHGVQWFFPELERLGSPEPLPANLRAWGRVHDLGHMPVDLAAALSSVSNGVWCLWQGRT